MAIFGWDLFGGIFFVLKGCYPKRDVWLWNDQGDDYYFLSQFRRFKNDRAHSGQLRVEEVIGCLNVSERDFVNSLAPCDERPEKVLGERWTPPLQGSLKINKDAASKNGDAAIAMVLRDF